MAIGSYQRAMQEAQSSGQAGRIVPSGGGAGPITYRFVPSGPAPTGPATAATAPAGPATPKGGLTPAALVAFKKAKAYYQPGGGFGKGVEAGLERGRTRSMASGMQSLVSSGLAGTTIAAGLGKKYEEEVAAPTMAGVEGERARSLSSLSAAMGGAEQAGFESASDRALREWMARLQAGTSVQLAGMRQPTGGGGGYTSRQPTTRFDVSRPAPTGGGYFTGRGREEAKPLNLFKIPTAAPTLAPFTTAERTEAGRAITRTGSKLMSFEDRYQGGWTG